MRGGRKRVLCSEKSMGPKGMQRIADRKFPPLERERKDSVERERERREFTETEKEGEESRKEK